MLAYWQFVVKIARPLALPLFTVDLQGSLADPAICSQEIYSTRIDDLFLIDTYDCKIQMEISEALAHRLSRILTNKGLHRTSPINRSTPGIHGNPRAIRPTIPVDCF
ncbi:hypothetical protein [Variovorax boronicumulans]|uniref:hypothetical protein n=1 Tax=Variovorax boronicumulans TaxID=436515 RepID=UPI001C204F5D|nr:hypothetical protein [Variovorax boronicumulans]